MMRLLMFALSFCVLAGCSPQNTSLNRLQFSGDMLPFPENYQGEAAQVAIAAGADPEAVFVSYPKDTLGVSAFGPKRWYSCVRGLPPPVPADRLPNIEEALGTWLGSSPRIFDTVLVFSGANRPTVSSRFDSPLCRDAAFRRIVAEMPTT